MVKNIWECSLKDCGEKSVVPESCIPTGWVRLEFYYHDPNCQVCKPDVDEAEEDADCILALRVEACSQEHIIEAINNIFKSCESITNWRTGE